jgi:hypothetical protein
MHPAGLMIDMNAPKLRFLDSQSLSPSLQCHVLHTRDAGIALDSQVLLLVSEDPNNNKETFAWSGPSGHWLHRIPSRSPVAARPIQPEFPYVLNSLPRNPRRVTGRRPCRTRSFLAAWTPGKHAHVGLCRDRAKICRINGFFGKSTVTSVFIVPFFLNPTHDLFSRVVHLRLLLSSCPLSNGRVSRWFHTLDGPFLTSLPNVPSKVR